MNPFVLLPQRLALPVLQALASNTPSNAPYEGLPLEGADPAVPLKVFHDPPGCALGVVVADGEGRADHGVRDVCFKRCHLAAVLGAGNKGAQKARKFPEEGNGLLEKLIGEIPAVVLVEEQIRKASELVHAGTAGTVPIDPAKAGLCDGGWQDNVEPAAAVLLVPDVAGIRLGMPQG